MCITSVGPPAIASSVVSITRRQKCRQAIDGSSASNPSCLPHEVRRWIFRSCFVLLIRRLVELLFDYMLYPRLRDGLQCLQSISNRSAAGIEAELLLSFSTIVSPTSALHKDNAAPKNEKQSQKSHAQSPKHGGSNPQEANEVSRDTHARETHRSRDLIERWRGALKECGCNWLVRKDCLIRTNRPTKQRQEVQEPKQKQREEQNTRDESSMASGVRGQKRQEANRHHNRCEDPEPACL
jgi:hypothetical protein